jgi:hypothetical protein
MDRPLNRETGWKPILHCARSVSPLPGLFCQEESDQDCCRMIAQSDL